MTQTAVTKTVKDKVQTALAPAKDINSMRPDEKVNHLLHVMEPELRRALPQHITPERMTRIALTCVRLTPKLLECSIPSLLGSVMQAAQLGLEPGILGQCYLVPFKNQVQFIIGYLGYIELFFRTGRIETVFANESRERDFFDYRYGTDEYLHHKEARGARGAITDFYAYVRMTGSSAYRFKVMSVDDVQLVRDSTDGYKAFKAGKIKSNPWATDFEAMGRKTLIRRLSTWVPKSVEIQSINGAPAMTIGDAFAMDETVLPAMDAVPIQIGSDSIDEETGEVTQTESPAQTEQTATAADTASGELFSE